VCFWENTLQFFFLLTALSTSCLDVFMFVSFVIKDLLTIAVGNLLVIIIFAISIENEVGNYIYYIKYKSINLKF
jgi:hypothetical protein